jgi:nicotinamidase-related amidase
MKPTNKTAAQKKTATKERPGQALILIDVINDFDFPRADQLLRYALPASRKIATLKGRAKRSRVPVIYANDNFGRWRSDFHQQIEHCMAEKRPGRAIVELLKPDEDDYFVLKPMHSAFFSTTLEVLLERLQIQRLVLTGFAADICVLYTANDAYMRDFKVVVPCDCIASETKRQYRFALDHMTERLKADTRTSDKVHFR